MDMQGYLEAIRVLPAAGTCNHGNVPPTGRDFQQQVSIAIVLVSLGCMYSVHNLIAPNMTTIANLFHFNAYERDTYVGGELTIFFYFPGVLGALLAGVLSGLLERRLILAVLASLIGIACLLTTLVRTFGQLLFARAVAGFGIGATLPVVYSLVGDWYPARKRASATAFVTAASGAGVFAGQCLSTLVGSADWRWPFFIIALPCVASSATIWCMADEPVRGGKEDGIETLSLYQSAGFHYSPIFTGRHLKALVHNRTNMLVILQAFPGNIPWGVIIVYIHDFLVQDLGLSRHSALGAITMLAGAAFAGVLAGGFVGELLYGANTRHLALFGGCCNIVRSVPFFVLFGWQKYFGSFQHSSEGTFVIVLMLGGFVATMASPCTGAMLLNVNLPETRGSVMAMYTVLDDLSKGFGTLFVSMIVSMVGGRAVAYQISLLVWVFTGIALLLAWHTYDEDEQQMRKHLDEAAMESMVVMSKQRSQQAIREYAKAAGEAHFAQRNLGARRDQLADVQRVAATCQNAKSGCSDTRVGGIGGINAVYGAISGGSRSVSAAVTLTAKTLPKLSPGCGGSSGRHGGLESADKDRLHRAVRAAAEAAMAAPRARRE